MTFEQIKAMLEETKFQVAYQVFPESVVPKMPFICWEEISPQNFAADGGVFYSDRHIEIQLFTEKKDTQTEATLESVLNSHGLYWIKDIEFMDDEHCYRAIYQASV